MNVPIAYSILMFVAIAAGAILLRRSQEKLPLHWTEKACLGLGAFCGSILGAKVPFLFDGISDVGPIWVWFANGKTILGGMVGGYLGVEGMKWGLGIKIKTGDSFVVPAAVAVAIGRLACFAGGCCFGAPTKLPWGIPFALSGDSAPRHPTQLYEAAFHISAAILLFWMQKNGVWKGQLMKAYLIAYLSYRFLTEFIRPEAIAFSGLTIYQLACLLMIPVFAWLWRRDSIGLRAG